MSDLTPSIIEKCKGAMLATAIGDALGWPNERRGKKGSNAGSGFVLWTRREFRPDIYGEPILPGEYSDDTQLTLSVARSLLSANWTMYFPKIELPFWLSYARGGGRATKNAARFYNDKKKNKDKFFWESSPKIAKDYFAAGGNGAAMRILPHVIFDNARNSELSCLMENVVKDTLFTHGHPRAILGANCYAYALDYLLKKTDILKRGELITAAIEGRAFWGKFPFEKLPQNWHESVKSNAGYDYTALWDDACDRLEKKLHLAKDAEDKGPIADISKALHDLECFSESKGAGDVAAAAAIFLASHFASDPELGIKYAAFEHGIDTDTIASMTGGLLGMLSGVGWITLGWEAVQDYEYISKLTNQLLDVGTKSSSPVEPDKGNDLGQEWQQSPIGKMKLLETKELLNNNRKIILSKKMQMEFGQTIYITERMPAEAPVEQPEELKSDKVKSEPRFIMSLKDVEVYLGESNIKEGISFASVCKALRLLMGDAKTSYVKTECPELDPKTIEYLNASIEFPSTALKPQRGQESKLLAPCPSVRTFTFSPLYRISIRWKKLRHFGKSQSQMGSRISGWTVRK